MIWGSGHEPEHTGLFRQLKEQRRKLLEEAGASEGIRYPVRQRDESEQFAEKVIERVHGAGIQYGWRFHQRCPGDKSLVSQMTPEELAERDGVIARIAPQAQVAGFYGNRFEHAYPTVEEREAAAKAAAAAADRAARTRPDSLLLSGAAE